MVDPRAEETGSGIIPAPGVLPDTYIKWKFGVGQYATTSSPAVTTDTDGKTLLIPGSPTPWSAPSRTTAPALPFCGKPRSGTADRRLAGDQRGRIDRLRRGRGGPVRSECPTGELKWKFSTGSAKVDSTAALSSGRDSLFRLPLREPTDRLRDQPGGVERHAEPICAGFPERDPVDIRDDQCVALVRGRLPHHRGRRHHLRRDGQRHLRAPAE